MAKEVGTDCWGCDRAIGRYEGCDSSRLGLQG